MSMPMVDSRTRIVPVRDNVLVRRDPLPEVTETGIHIPKTQRRAGDMSEGEVLSVPTDYNGNIGVGKRVMFGNFAGTVVDKEDPDLLLMTFDDIRAIVME